jgi:hypothetical protein
VSEQPDLSSLKAGVCGPTAEKLWGPSGSLLWYRDEPHTAQGGIGDTPDPQSQG